MSRSRYSFPDPAPHIDDLANDELSVEMAPESEASHPLYPAYYDHFNDAYDAK